MPVEKKNIRNLDFSELEAYFKKIKEKPFRVKQVYDWIWLKHATQFEHFYNVPKELINKLKEDFIIPCLTIDKTQTSIDGTMKFRFKTWDNFFIEGVLIPQRERYTACISSQIGCSLDCTFCATGKMKLKRQLQFDEIYDQVQYINKVSVEKFDKKITSIVFMGMGEPLLNYSNVMKAIEKICLPSVFGMSPKRITISTSGIVKMIKKMADDNSKCNLAISLHATNDLKRSKLMPINQSNNIKALFESINYYYTKTKNRITLEYVLLKDVNDTIDDAKELVHLYKKNIISFINLIEYNPIEDSSFIKSSEDSTQVFLKYLQDLKINVRLRRSRGKEIDAACGQLANK